MDYSIRVVSLDKLENLDPIYMMINERGTVPTLKHGQQVIKTYEEILQYLEKTYSKFL